MLKVGVPDSVDPELLKRMPEGVELRIVSTEPQHDVELDLWLVPPNRRVAERMWPHLKGVRVAQSSMAGVDWLLRMVSAGVTVCDAQGVHNISTAEWAVAAILAVLKHFTFYDEVKRSGDWSHRRHADEHYRAIHGLTRASYPPAMVEELYGKHVLIVGYGAIGEAIERRLGPFEVAITRVARSARPGVAPVSELHGLLPYADIVVLIVPLTRETAGMIGAREIGLMKRGALLVNAARGPIIVTDALLAALQEGRIRAALDVTDPEPLPAGHPLWSAPNLLMTPHVAGSSPRFMERVMDLLAEQASRMLRGEPLRNVVTGLY